MFLLLVGKRVQIRKAPQSIPDAVPERKRSTPINPANTIRKTHTNNSISQRPYKDRIIHLLALKTYKKPELLARLLKDGVSQKDRNSLAAILQQVKFYLYFCFLLVQKLYLLRSK
uniref:RNA polymerase II elongation factor ELL N-terminal domain-containing protein n=1 Tax=Micrurus corallinus TaxID=54390 RepID=A0A2D4ERX3_MICCO